MKPSNFKIDSHVKEIEQALRNDKYMVKLKNIAKEIYKRKFDFDGKIIASFEKGKNYFQFIEEKNDGSKWFFESFGDTVELKCIEFQSDIDDSLYFEVKSDYCCSDKEKIEKMTNHPAIKLKKIFKDKL